MTTEARNIGLLVLLAACGILGAYQLAGDLFFDFGPNDGGYVQGFREDFEVDEPTLIHWASDNATLRLPVYVRGPYDVTLRYKRHIAAPAEIRVFFGGALADTRTVPQQDFALWNLRVQNASGGPLTMSILSSSDDPRPLSLALDWIQIRPSRRFGAILPSVLALAAMLSWVLAFYAVPRMLGCGQRVSWACGAFAALALMGLALAHKMWPVHAAWTLGLRTHVIAFLFVGFFWIRRGKQSSAFAIPEARWAVLIVYLGFAVRLFALFHPDFYYPDVRTHSKFVYLIWTEGLDGFFLDFIRHQHTYLLGLQYVGDRWLAFPYPPLLYLTIYPLSVLHLPVEDWMKLVPTALVAVESLIVFALARRLGISGQAATFAVALHATARVVGFRLAVASYGALFGHFWDSVAILYLALFFDRLDRPRYAIGFSALIAISLLSYAGSALVLGMFVPVFCLAFYFVARSTRPPTVRLVAIAGWALLGALVAVGAFYLQYIPELLIRPEHAGVLNGDPSQLVSLSFTPLSALSMSAHRMNLFYGPVFTLLTLGTLIWLFGRSGDALARPLAIAAIATFLGLNFLRAGLGPTHIFQFSKDDLVVLPLVVLALGILLEHGWRKRTGRILGAVAIIGWMGWSVVAFSGDIRSRFIRPDYPPEARGGPPSTK